MNELPLKIKKAISRYQPVEVEGFTFYPITVEEYDNFLIASSAIDFMQQSLPMQSVWGVLRQSSAAYNA